jgi:hypothetical protein
MTTRRWIGVGLILLGIAVGAVLQACCGTPFRVTVTTTREEPEKTIGDADFMIKDFVATTHVISISPKWPVALPLALLICTGLVLVVIPGKCPKHG